MEHDKRPWGEYWVLEDTATHKVKKVLVNQGQRLSLQYHKFRSEVWTIVSGIATVTIEGEEKQYNVGEAVYVPQGAVHRIANYGDIPLIFIEVQYGTYFGEDDIIRIEDDYNRE